ncbi:MAG: NAD-dependent epimerase/dehydratase family protein [Phycisphaerales bacterium]
MTSGVHLVTGATGFLGSHLVERLVRDGCRVRVLVRSSSDTTVLDRLDVEKVTGDLTEPSIVERVCRGVEVVYHAAAKVVDWGPWSHFERDIVEATKNLAHAAQRSSVGRFVHISSVSAYEYFARKGLVYDEASPLIGRMRCWDHYGFAKARAERELWDLHDHGGLPLTVLRPAWIYGPRDRVIVPHFHRLLSAGAVRILGDGRNLVSTISIASVVDMCLLAAASEQAIGQAYNCSSDGPITQRELLGLWADAFGCPRPTHRVPYPLAFGAAFACECAGHLLRRRTPPPIMRRSVEMLARRPYFPTDKAQKQLGWRPAMSYREGIALAARWYLDHLKSRREGNVV